MLSGGQRHDSVFLRPALEVISIPQRRGRPKSRPQCVVADKAYDSKNIRHYLRRRGIQGMIPEKALRPGTFLRKKGPHYRFDQQQYKERNIIERLFGWFKTAED